MEVKTNTYKDLIVWQKAILLVTDIYLLTKTFPQDERFVLVSQLNRAVISIPSNIAEGSSRSSDKDYNRFIEISLGSCFEAETQFQIEI